MLIWFSFSLPGTDSNVTIDEGDTLGVQIDFHARTLSFYKNGVALGIAFTIPSNVGLWPAVSLHATGSSVLYIPGRLV